MKLSAKESIDDNIMLSQNCSVVLSNKNPENEPTGGYTNCYPVAKTTALPGESFEGKICRGPASDPTAAGVILSQ